MADNDQREKKPIAGTILGLAGLGIASNAYHSGAITGRETSYHGTSVENADKIREGGIHPGRDRGTTGVAKDRMGANFGGDEHVFAARQKAMAAQYVNLAQKVQGLHGKEKDDRILKFMTDNVSNPVQNAMDAQKVYFSNLFTGYGKGSPFVKVNAPVGDTAHYKRVNNPEWEAVKESIMFKLQPPLQQRATEKLLNEDMRTFKGHVPPEYIINSKEYKSNSASEILNHIKRNPSMFGKGVAKATAGLGLSAVGVHAATVGHKKQAAATEEQRFNKYVRTRQDHQGAVMGSTLKGLGFGGMASMIAFNPPGVLKKVPEKALVLGLPAAGAALGMATGIVNHTLPAVSHYHDYSHIPSVREYESGHISPTFGDAVGGVLGGALGSRVKVPASIMARVKGGTGENILRVLPAALGAIAGAKIGDVAVESHNNRLLNKIREKYGYDI